MTPNATTETQEKEQEQNPMTPEETQQFQSHIRLSTTNQRQKSLERAKSNVEVQSFVSSSHKDLWRSLSPSTPFEDFIDEKILVDNVHKEPSSSSQSGLDESNQVFGNEHNRQQRRRRLPRRTGLIRSECKYGMDVVGNHVDVIRRWIELVHRTAPGAVGEKERSTLRSALRRNLKTSNNCDEDDGSNLVSDSFLPLGVNVHDGLEDAFHGLNVCLDAAYKEQTQKNLEREEEEEEERESQIEQFNEVRRIVEAVARIPGLMKTILLIEDENDRSAILNFPVICRVMLCRFSVMNQQEAKTRNRKNGLSVHNGDCSKPKLKRLRRTKRKGGRKWTSEYVASVEAVVREERDTEGQKSWLLEMLKSGDKTLAHIAIDYLEMISDLTIEDYLSIDSNRPNPEDLHDKDSLACFIPENDLRDFEEERHKLFQTIGGFRSLLPYLFALGGEYRERASVTAVVSHVLDHVISMPFSMLVIFLDFINNPFLIFGFRYYAHEGLFDDGKQTKVFLTFQDDVISTFINFMFLMGWYYAIFRFLGESIAMLRISWMVFIRYLLSFWVLVNVVSLVLVTSLMITRETADDSSYETDTFFRLSAVTIGLLWMNFIGFLRVVNKKFAVFILATSQILLDVMLFAMIVIMVICAFGDMFFIIFNTSGHSCSDENFDEETHFCTNRWKGYLAVYGIFLGEFSLSPFEASPMTMTLFILLTFIGVIILLNMLIAIADESYERSRLKSSQFFGRARLGFVAKLVALEDLIHPNVNNKFSSRKSFFRWCQAVLMKVLFLGFKVLLLVTLFIFALSFLKSTEGTLGAASYIILFIFFLPTVSLSILSISYLFYGWRTYSHDGKKGTFIKMVVRYNLLLWRCTTNNPLMRFVSRFLGRTIMKDQDIDDEDGWDGRIRRIESHVQETVTESEERMRRNLVPLKERLERMEGLILLLLKNVKEQDDRVVLGEGYS